MSDEHADLLRRAAANMAAAYLEPTRAVGRPSRTWDDLWVSDLGLPVTLSPNNATLLKPIVRGSVDDLLSRVRGFFGERAGGGYEIYSVWPTPDLSGFGLDGGDVPLMVHPAGNVPPPPPQELEIIEAHDDLEFREVAEIQIDAFGIAGGRAQDMWDSRTLGSGMRFWLGRVEGRPVSTAAAYVSHGFVGIYAVGTLTSARGHGYGEALTWAAMRARPDLPGMLQASEMGRSVYERMGYETVASCSVWSSETR